MENTMQNQENKKIKMRKVIIWGIAAVLIVVILGGVTGYIYKYEEWKMARLAKSNQLVDKYLREYLGAKARIKSDKNDFSAYNQKGFAEAELGYFKAAEKDYLKSLEINPAGVFTLNYLVNLYLKIKNYPKAEEYYLKIIEIDSKNSMAYQGLVTLYYDFYPEKKNEIEKVLLKGIEQLPDDQNLLGLLGAYYRTVIKDIPKTIEVYERLLKLRPDDDLLKKEIESLRGVK